MALQQEPLSAAIFRDGVYQFPTRAPWLSSKACMFYNTSRCRAGAACTFNHSPDKRSLRLRLNGPNICKNHLLGEHGCEFAKKEGRKCWYSHDLTQAGLPLHDKDLTKKTLIMLEALIMCNGARSDELVELQELTETMLKTNGSTKYEIAVELNKIYEKYDQETLAWTEEMQKHADDVLKQVKGGEPVGTGAQYVTPVLDVTGLSGAQVLLACGVKEPFVSQQERKRLSIRLAATPMPEDGDEEWEDIDDSSVGGGFLGFSEDDIMELACQGIKPWDDDAADALMMLRGGF